MSNGPGRQHYNRGNRKPAQPKTDPDKPIPYVPRTLPPPAPVVHVWTPWNDPIKPGVMAFYCVDSVMTVYQADGTYAVVRLDRKEVACFGFQPNKLYGLVAALAWLTAGGIEHAWEDKPKRQA